jgi:hypothetical protein
MNNQNNGKHKVSPILIRLVLLVLILGAAYIALVCSIQVKDSTLIEKYTSLTSKPTSSKNGFNKKLFYVTVNADGTTTLTLTSSSSDIQQEDIDTATAEAGTTESSSGDTKLIVDGDTIDFSSCPYSKFCYTYMGWQMITSQSSPQYIWRKSKYPNWDSTIGDVTAFDDEGFGVVDGRYVVAVSWIDNGGIADVGQTIDVYVETSNGTVIIPCVVGEIKSSGDSNWTVWGHEASADTMNTIEFLVNKNNTSVPTWYPSGTGSWHGNPGTSVCHPEWKGKIVKIVRGSYV